MKKVLFVLMLAGCGGGPMQKVGVTQAQADQDRAECNYEAEKSTASMREGLDRALRRIELTDSCLRMRGYVAVR